MRWLLSTLAVGLIACGRSEPHELSPTTPQTLCQAIMGEPQVKAFAAWPSGACLDVTFEPGALENARGLHAALLEWAGAPGTWLCFNPPREATAASPRAVHVRTPEPNPTGATALVEVTFRGTALVSAEATFEPTVTLTHGAYLHAAGQLLGFQRTEGVDSAVNALTLGDVHSMLTGADLQSVAAVYPACR